MKTCMFQYATNHRILVDTDLITQDEGLALFEKNKDDFIQRMKNDENPEMAIWVDCATNDSYRKTLLHWYAEDFKIIDDELWQKV